MKIRSINIWLCLEVIFILSAPLIISSPLFKLISPNEIAHKSLFFGLLILRTVAIIRVIKFIISRFHRNYIKTKQPEKRTNSILLATALITVLLMLETIFQFIPQNQDVYKLGLATKVWNAYYKKSENEKGFRDKPVSGRLNSEKQIVFFLGDSFTYGTGIKHEEDRFPDMVASKLDPNKFECFNLGKGNTDTNDELLRLVNFGVTPDYVILQYYHNDIEKIGAKYGHFNLGETGYKNKKGSGIKKMFSSVMMFPLRFSFLLNYIGMNSSKFFIPKSRNNYKECLTDAYNDTTCVKEHFRDLKTIFNYCSYHHIKLYVLLMPDMRDIQYTGDLFESHLIPFLKTNNVNYITVDEQLKNHKVSDLVINPLNAHTNAFANSIIAARIVKSVPDFKK